jgi:hypothetical protein
MTGVNSLTATGTTTLAVALAGPLYATAGVVSSETTLAKARGGSGQDNSSLTFPATGTLATLAGAEALTNKTIVAGSNTITGITNAMMANMAQSTIKGRAVSAGTGVATDLTATQATAILDNMVGDSGAGGTKGLVPAPGSGDTAANKYLKAGGTWVNPSPLTTKGDVYTYSTLDARLGVGSNGQFLTAESGETTGLKWESYGVYGTANFAATDNCTWSQSSFSGVTAFPVDGDCPSPTVTGSVEAAATNLPAIQIVSAPKGAYRVTVNAAIFAPGASTRCVYVLTDGTTNTGRSEVDNTNLSSILTGTYNYASSGTRVFEIRVARTNGADVCTINIASSTSERSLYWSVERFPAY